jgi:hypothetical protein
MALTIHPTSERLLVEQSRALAFRREDPAVPSEEDLRVAAFPGENGRLGHLGDGHVERDLRGFAPEAYSQGRKAIGLP